MPEKDCPNGNRTHEPSLRELTAELDGLRNLFMERCNSIKELMDERHQHYKERDSDRQTEVEKAQASMNKAVDKAEQSQAAYNKTHNDLMRQMGDERAEAKADQMPRKEIEGKFETIEQKVQEQKQELTRIGSRDAGASKSKEDNRVLIAIVISGVVALMGLAGLAITIVTLVMRLKGG
jgi:hypothetical protein